MFGASREFIGGLPGHFGRSCQAPVRPLYFLRLFTALVFMVSCGVNKAPRPGGHHITVTAVAG